MIKARTSGSPTPGSPASARRNSTAGTSRISDSSTFSRAPTLGEHRHIACKIARSGGRDNQLLAIALLKRFDLAADHHHEPKFAPTNGVNCLAAAHFPALAHQLGHRELPIVQLRKRDALRVTVELLIYLFVWHACISIYRS